LRKRFCLLRNSALAFNALQREKNNTGYFTVNNKMRPLDILALQAYPPPMKPKDPVAEYVRKLASAGGKARKKKLTAKRRKAIAKKAARARWRKK